MIYQPGASLAFIALGGAADGRGRVMVRNMTTLHVRRGLLLLCLALLTQGCAMDGVRRVTFINEHSTPVNGVLVVPLYSISVGIGVGPDGQGLFSTARLLVEKPFVCESGDDLMRQKIQTRGCCVFPLPLIFIGKMRPVDSWLFVKKHYAPRAIRGDYINGDAPISLTYSTGNESEVAIDILLLPKPDQQALKKLFDVKGMKEDVQVNLDDAARALLKAQK